MYSFRPRIILDPTDIKILDILQDDAATHVNRIAAKVFKSPSATHERIYKMRQLGVIKKYIVVLDRRLVGRPTLVVTLVRLNNHSAATLKGFAMAMEGISEVQNCLHLSGEFDFLLQVSLCDAQQYDEFLETRLCCLPMVERVQSSFVLKECKTMAALPLL